MAGPWRHSLFSGRPCSRILTDLGQQLPGSTYSGVALDPVHRIWLAQYNGEIFYGTYNRAGLCTHLGSVPGIPSGTGITPTDVRLDLDLCCWFCAAQSGNSIYYGTYSPSTGQPTHVGHIDNLVTSTNGLNGLVLDTDLRRWWAGNDNGSMIAYGIYDASGVPTQAGTQTVATSQSQSMMIDIARRHLWSSGAPYVYSYDAAGLLTATTTPYVDVWRGAIDQDRSVAVAASADRTRYVLYDVAADGGLIELDSLSRSTTLFAFDVDPNFGLALCSDGHMISYCA
ncbi:MAG: hypothetical protein V3573_06675 [Desulfovibrionaceae bacterium]